MAATPTTIEHRITATNQFDGTVPSTTPADDADLGLRKYPADNNGGRFNPMPTSQWLYEVSRIAADFADAATVEIAIVNADGDVVTIYSAAAGGKVLITDTFKLLPDEYIRIVTTAATAAMMARVTQRPFMPKPS